MRRRAAIEKGETRQGTLVPSAIHFCVDPSKIRGASQRTQVDYFYQSKTNLEEAVRWINTSVASQENAGNVLLRAKIPAELKRFDEAIQAAQRTIRLQKATNPQESTTEAEKLIVDWTKSRLN